jgi:hypothetical protein
MIIREYHQLRNSGIPPGDNPMRLSSLCAILALLFSTATLAQESMPMAGGNMGKPMMATQMPQQVEDSRQVIPLTKAEIAIVAGKMRQMLATVQGITEGLAKATCRPWSRPHPEAAGT